MTTPAKPAYVDMQGAITKVVKAHGALVDGIHHATKREHESRQQRYRKLEQQRALEATKPLPNA